MANAVGATLHELHCDGGRLRRYCSLAWRTVALIRKCSPDVIFFQNPSMMLAALIVAMKSLRLTHAAVIGDFHNAGLFPPVARLLVPWLVKGCDVVIVSNSNLEARVVAMGGRCVSVPDPLPQLSLQGGERRRDGRFRVLMICSWAEDEPVAEVLRAAEILRRTAPEALVAITGRPVLAKQGWTGPLPDNVELTGFLSEEEFERRLKCSDLVMDLTTRDDCMVCGAYEAVSAEIAMVISANEPTMRYFSKGSVFTNNAADDIARCIVDAIARHDVLMREVKELKNELLAKEREVFGSLTETVRRLTK